MSGLPNRRHGGHREAAATLVTLELCEELGEPLIFSSNAERERERERWREKERERGRDREIERIGRTSK